MNNEETILEDLRRHESLRLKPYKCSADKLTIGYGCNLEAGITKRIAEFILEEQMRATYIELREKSNLSDYPPSVQRALINMAYQMGVPKLLKFKKTFALLDKGEYNKAADEALDSGWAKQTPRRAVEVTEWIRQGEK